MELYDPQAASWTQQAGMAGPRFAHGCVALEGKLYAMCGYGAGSAELDTAEVYDPQTDGWQPLAKMITGRSKLGLAAVGGKIYAIGGSIGDEALDSVEAYDPQLGSWALVASMSEKRRDHASVVLDGKTPLAALETMKTMMTMMVVRSCLTRQRSTTLRPTAGSRWRACRKACIGTPLQRWVARSMRLVGAMKRVTCWTQSSCTTRKPMHGRRWLA